MHLLVDEDALQHGFDLRKREWMRRLGGSGEQIPEGRLALLHLHGGLPFTEHLRA